MNSDDRFTHHLYGCREEVELEKKKGWGDEMRELGFSSARRADGAPQ